MDSSVQKMIGCKKSTKFVFKKLPLAGNTGAKGRYFETISEANFSSVTDKDLFGIDSLKLSRYSDCDWLAGIEVKTINGEIKKHHGDYLDSQGQSTTSLKDFEIDEIKVIKQTGSVHPIGFKFLGKD